MPATVGSNLVHLALQEDMSPFSYDPSHCKILCECHADQPVKVTNHPSNFVAVHLITVIHEFGLKIAHSP